MQHDFILTNKSTRKEYTMTAAELSAKFHEWLTHTKEPEKGYLLYYAAHMVILMFFEEQREAGLNSEISNKDYPAIRNVLSPVYHEFAQAMKTSKPH